MKKLAKILFLVGVFIICSFIGYHANAQTPAQYCKKVSTCEVLDVKSSTGSNGIGQGSITTYVKKYCSAQNFLTSTQIIHAEYASSNIALRRLNNTGSSASSINQSALTTWMNDCNASM